MMFSKMWFVGTILLLANVTCEKVDVAIYRRHDKRTVFLDAFRSTTSQSAATIAKTGLILNLRGGGSTSMSTTKHKNAKRQHKSTSSNSKRKNKKRHSKKSSTKDDYDSTRIDQSDSASFLGDAIRDRADILLSDVIDPRDFSSCAATMSSFGSSTTTTTKELLTEEGGGVEAAPTSVLANYFLKSHGGAHAFQCGCSLLTTLTGTGALLLPSSSSWRGNLKYFLLKGTFIFAMTKHLSHFLASAYVAVAKSTIRSGRTTIHESWQDAQRGLEHLLGDPISQYVFYCALVLLWMPMTKNDVINRWWWKNENFCQTSATLLLGPILMKEIVSTIFVTADVIALLSTGKDIGDGSISAIATPATLRIGQQVVNAIMNILSSSPSTWTNADPMARQQILAKVTSNVCLSFEVLVGAFLTVDGLIALWKPSSSFWKTGKRLICARIYLNYLWTTQRKKTQKLWVEIQNGASEFPERVLNVLLDPQESMGLSITKTTDDRNNKKKETDINSDTSQYTPSSWYELTAVALGFNEK